MAAEGKPLGPLVDAKEPVVDAPVDNAVSPRIRRVHPRSRNRTIIIALVALALISGSAWLWHYLGGYESTDDAQVDVHLAPVSARISGYVTKVNVNDNQYVEKGTVLVEIDPKDFQVAVDKARADLANAEANAQALNISIPITSVNTSSQITSSASDVQGATAGVTAAESQLAAAKAQVAQAEANNVKAQDDLQRYKRLVEKQNVSEQTYDQALAAAKANTAGVAAAQANETAAQQGVQQAKSRLAQAEASQRYALTGPQQVATTRARAKAALADVQ
ncbi:MAG TPA: biotin/lipoyl-binding protein, partial [Terriglobales bacterium]